MLDSYSDLSENNYFDALEEIDDGNCVSCSSSSSSQFDVWVHNPESVETRRSKFFKWLGLDVDEITGYDSEESSDCDRGIKNVRSEGFQHELSTSMSSLSSLSCDDLSGSQGDFAHGVEDRIGGVEGDVDAQRPQMNPSSSSFSGEFLPVKNTDKDCSVGPTKKVKKWWLSRLRSFSCVTENGEESCEYDSTFQERIQRVKVHQSGKHSKDLSALYSGQTIQAHKGTILTMKFSPDGQFLASGGEDRIVRVWQVMELDRSIQRDIPNMDPSSVYFTMNQFSELKPLSTEKEKNTGLRRNSDSACVVLPPKVFRLSEKPVHEFGGHTSEILDLSWSNSNCLLSSSVDKTVRLWRVGHNHCLKVFPHNNYVTCVEFNPVDENHFISGSIDGKVRVWEISLCKVVYWTEIKDIVTAVCYRPDGRGGIIGSRSGSCRFFSISDYQLQLHAQISLHNKKKSSGKRITGFQFCPRDPSKVMISCADSQFRIVQGVDVIGKYKAKGARSSGTFSSAQFTSDGKRIISASEDSNVHIWKCADHDSRESSHVKKVKSSERFISNASIALPWPGLQNETRGNKHQNVAFRHGPSFSPINFSCGEDLFQESNYPKGSALWPEEKLLNPKKTSSIHKSEYKFLRTCQSKSDSHAWGMVIVTAGWDGKIRSFLNYGLPVPH
ncbi:uncharacterized protein LOC141606403 [Silene latifolia]|uniref:uncharacterized protein LOC141606403 n=1 Tax=Silene latifolia TaxID=37657 RepID=UPI003D779508